MKAGLVEMIFIIDRSGSMSGLEDETMGGFNSLIEKQKREPGEAYVTTVLFDNEYEVLHDRVALRDVPKMTNAQYWPRGTTALLDAIGKTVNDVGKRLSETPEEERPEQVIVVITTDGYENASREYSRSKVKEMIERQQKEYSWTFMFLGANIDAVAEGRSFGIDERFARNYTASKSGQSKAYSVLGQSMSAMRSYSASNSRGISSGMSAEASSSAGYSAGASYSLEEAREKAAKALDDVE